MPQGTVLGRVSLPEGARNGHRQFAIRPAGDPQTIDPRPILSNWVVVEHEGDGTFAAFPDAGSAAAAAVQLSRAIAAAAWPGDARP